MKSALEDLPDKVFFGTSFMRFRPSWVNSGGRCNATEVAYATMADEFSAQ
jgi:hypothetical protein